MNRLLVIYSRSVKRIKLKYFLRYYEKVVLVNYLNNKKLYNKFNKNPIKYSNSSSNLKSNSNYETIKRSTKASSSYFLNKSDPFIYTPKIINKKMAYLMTPCYIVDNDDLNKNNISQYNKKFGKNILNGFYLPSPKKEKTINRTKSSEFLNNEDPFYSIYIKNLQNRKQFEENNNNKGTMDRNFNLYSARNKALFPFEERKNNLFGNDINPIEYNSKYLELKRPISSDKKNNAKNKINNDFHEFIPLYKKRNKGKKFNDLFFNNKKKNMNKDEIFNFGMNGFTLGGDNNNGKVLTKNRSNLLQIENNNDFKVFNPKNNYNKEILDHLYENNYINNNKNLKKQDFGFNKRKKDNNNNNKNNIFFEINTAKKPNSKYSIFNSNNINENSTNKSKDFLFRNNQNKKEIPYNKIFNKDLISSSNFSFMNNSKKIQNNKDTKSINKSNPINNNSNNSNTQSINAGVNRVSTNYSIGPGVHSYYSSNRDTQKRNNNNTMNKIKGQINSKPPSLLQITPVIVDDFFKESSQKKNSNNSSNEVSLQSLSDSKMLELAGHYGLGEESSSDNYQMNNVIHNKIHFKKKFQKIGENNYKIQKKNQKIKKSKKKK